MQEGGLHKKCNSNALTEAAKNYLQVIDAATTFLERALLTISSQPTGRDQGDGIEIISLA